MRTLLAVAVAGVALYWAVRGSEPPTPTAAPAAPAESPPSPPRPTAASSPFPDGCRNLAECEAYCAKPENRRSCLEFIGPAKAPPPEAPAAGPLPEMLDPGPGECRTARECEGFCRKPENRAECDQFASVERQRVMDRLAYASPKALACVEAGDPARLQALRYGSLPMTFRLRQELALCLPAEQGRQKVSQGVNIADAPADCTDLPSCLTLCHDPDYFDECLEWKALPQTMRSTILSRQNDD